MEFNKLCVQLLREFEIQSARPEIPFKRERFAVAVYRDHWLEFRVR